MKKRTLLIIGLLLTTLANSGLAQRLIEKDRYKISPSDKYRYISLMPRNEIGILGSECEISDEKTTILLYTNTDNDNALMSCQNFDGTAPFPKKWSYLPGLWQLDVYHDPGGDPLKSNSRIELPRLEKYDWETTTLLGIGTNDPQFTLSILQDGGILAKGQELGGTVDVTDTIPDFYDIFLIRHNGQALPGLPLFWWYPQKGAFRAQYMRFDSAPATKYYDLWGQTDTTTVIANCSTTYGTIENFDCTKDGNIGYYSTALGDSNVAAGRASFVAGKNNKSFNHLSSIVGGSDNVIDAQLRDPVSNSGLLNFRLGSTIIAGKNNTISGPHNSITGGENNSIHANGSAIAGGAYNTIENYTSITNAADHDNALFPSSFLDETYSLILGGRQNKNYGRRSVIAGGIVPDDPKAANNIIHNDVSYSAIFQGIKNTIGEVSTPEHSVIAGGKNIPLIGSFSTILSTAGDNPAFSLGSYITPNHSFLVRPYGMFLGSSNYNVLLGKVSVFNTNNYTSILSNVATTNSTFTPQMAISNYSIIHGGGDRSSVINSPYAATINKGNLTDLNGAILSLATEGTANKPFSVMHGGTSAAEYSYTMVQFPNCSAEAGNINYADRSFFFGICPESHLGTSSGTVTDRFIIYGKYDHDASNATPDLEMRVGIGITAPEERLHVNGKIQAQTLVITDAVLPVAASTPIRTLDANPGPYEFIQGSDIAEIFPTHKTVEPGDIVAIDPEHPEKLRKSASAYDPAVIGVVSALPAVTFEGHQMVLASTQPVEQTVQPPVALAGRVLIKVSLENGPIKRGDLLTTSSTPGVAMRADRIPKARHAIVAKALQDFSDTNKGEMIIGLIMVR